ncbi:MAG: methylated-DNA--[protein]-cysteine S-methyltransferase [Rhodobacterales bacterium]|nr:methylated-DNA--[protein]-cysteine S-methyltransferase [Rhodobacterales bacterium]
MTDDPAPAYHYAVIARAIAEIDAAGPGLTLDRLAARMGMSAAHFQRVFSHWVGVSPKRYQQYLTLDLARRLLADRHTVLDTALAAGLSGTGRLHDLFLRWEAMRPGDYARGGAELVIRHGWFDSPFGPALVMGTDRGLCGIGFAAETGCRATLDDLRARWPNATHLADAAPLQPWAQAAFGLRTNDDRPLTLIGAPFQIKVWEALLHIPPGQVCTYSDLARAIGHPTATRAVGTAVGRNPIGWLIPCHRVLRRDGGLGGYHWGLPVKRAMLGWEAARADAADGAVAAR